MENPFESPPVPRQPQAPIVRLITPPWGRNGRKYLSNASQPDLGEYCTILELDYHDNETKDELGEAQEVEGSSR